MSDIGDYSRERLHFCIDHADRMHTAIINEAGPLAIEYPR